MVHRGNGRTIKIPVRRVERQLPQAEEKPRPLLVGPQDCREAVVEARAEVEAQVTDCQEQVSHWQTDVENARRRTERRAESQIQQERQRMLARLLAVADNLERALNHSDGNDALHAGVQLTLDDLLSQLAQEGVAPLHALGQPFDPHFHQAVATDGTGGDSVVEVLQAGYVLNGVLLRPARVVVGSR